MVLLKFLLLNLLAATCCLKVVNIQLFGTGNNSTAELKHFADLIKSHNPDVVIAQYGHSWGMKPLVALPDYLGERWSGSVHCNYYTAVYTKHKILNLTEYVSTGINAMIQLTESGLVVSVWSMHLEWSYNPDAFRYYTNKTLQSETMFETEKIRISEIVELLKHPQFVQQIKNSDHIPVIVAGDFNTLSHLDWTEGTKKLHNGMVIDWPVTKLLSGAAGMTDSYREVHPNASAHSGWTEHHYPRNQYTVRDMFIFYRGSLRPITASNFNSTEDVIVNDNQYNTQRAVQVEFEITPYKYENKPSFFIGDEYLRRTPITYGGCKA